jgi:hypothetical protein
MNCFKQMLKWHEARKCVHYIEQFQGVSLITATESKKRGQDSKNSPFVWPQEWEMRR